MDVTNSIHHPSSNAAVASSAAVLLVFFAFLPINYSLLHEISLVSLNGPHADNALNDASIRG